MPRRKNDGRYRTAAGPDQGRVRIHAEAAQARLRLLFRHRIPYLFANF
jgi:hypothetical protein